MSKASKRRRHKQTIRRHAAEQAEREANRPITEMMVELFTRAGIQFPVDCKIPQGSEIFQKNFRTAEMQRVLHEMREEGKLPKFLPYI